MPPTHHYAAERTVSGSLAGFGSHKLGCGYEKQIQTVTGHGSSALGTRHSTVITEFVLRLSKTRRRTTTVRL